MKHSKKKNRKTQKVQHMTKRTSVITFCCLLALVLAIGAGIYFGYDYYLYSGCTMEIDETVNYEQNFITSYSEPYSPIEEYRVEAVTHDAINDEYGIETYSVTTNFSTSPYPFGIDTSFKEVLADCPSPSEENTTFAEFSKRQENMIQSARELVIQYIKTSDIFRNKNELIESVQNVPFYLYKESELISLNVEWVPAQTHESAIYCNQLYDYAFCEAMFVHELIHHIRHQTTQETNPIYTGTKYDETLVEMITDSINPKDYTNVEVEYDLFMDPMKKYISLFGPENVLEAFFYGYDEFFTTQNNHLFELEHNAFAEIIGSYGAHPDSYRILEGFLGTWYDRLYA